MAESEGFEPSMELLTPYSLSRGAPSASRATLRRRDFARDEKDTGSVALRQTRIRVVAFATLDPLVDLFAMYGNIFGRRDSDPHLVALHSEDRHGDFVTDHQSFANPASQNEHCMSPMADVPLVGTLSLFRDYVNRGVEPASRMQ